MTLFLFEESASDGHQSQFSANCELQFFLREMSLYFRTKEQSQNTAQQNYPGSVIFYDTQPGNKVRCVYSTMLLSHAEQHNINMTSQNKQQCNILTAYCKITPSEQAKLFTYIQ